MMTNIPIVTQLIKPPIIIIGSMFEKFKLEKSNISVFIEPNKNAVNTVRTRQIKATAIIIIIFVKIGFLLITSPRYSLIQAFSLH